VIVSLDLASVESYRLFLKVKTLPSWRVQGRTLEFPDEYADLVGLTPPKASGDYRPHGELFDYQRDVSALAIRRRKFAAFIECGLGKTMIALEFARHALQELPKGKCALIVSPLMVVKQTVAEAARFYGDGLPIEQVRADGLQAWLSSGRSQLGITNYEAIREGLRPGRLGAGRGLCWKLCLTGTPAPNDRIEYGNHAVFLDQFPTVNAFLARYFVNRGQTDNRWELKPHALRPFYRSLSHWSIFVSNPAVYGWQDNAGTLPPIGVHLHEVPLTQEQRRLAGRAGGDMFGTPGGITSRAKLSQLAKGRFGGEEVGSNKPGYVRDLVHSWPGEGTLVWCVYNREQESVARVLPEAASLAGDTPEGERLDAVERFKAGDLKTIVTKPKILGFGLNLQAATRQVFSGLVDSYESYWQAVKRSNRVGSTRPLNVHIPVTDLERPMVETVLRKAARVEADTREQEALFRESDYVF
jgi:hypothetical protein